MNTGTVTAKTKEGMPGISKGTPVKSARLGGKESFHAVRASMKFEQQTHRGPLPSPKMLQEYNDVDPGFAERIVSMAERQAAHRQEIEKIAIKSGSRDSLIG